MRRILLGVLLAWGSSVFPAVPPYPTVELQARSNIVDGFNLPANSSFNSKTPALNDDATIAFSLIVVGGGNPGLFVGSGGIGSVVYSGPAGRVLSDPSINAAGEVAFDQSDITSEGIFVYDPDSTQTDLKVPAVTFSFAAGPTLTDSGEIGFRAGQFGGSRSWQMFDDPSFAIYASETGGVAYLFVSSTNDALQMAGKVRLNSTDESAPDQIRVYDGPGSFAIVAEDVDSNPGAAYTRFDNSPFLVDDGRVAFIAETVGGVRGVFLTDGTTDITIATETDPLVSDISFFSPAASSSGLVAFRGIDSNGLDAIFVGDGTELVRVIGEHDLVEIDLGTARIDQHDGSVVFGGGVALNELGDLAFNGALTPEGNNQIEWGSGMFIATASPAAPPPVPDGRGQGRPMTVARSGGDLVVRWDPDTCPADDTNLFFGDLALVSSVTISAADCSLGTSGSALVTPPPGDLFFVLASETDDGVESGHGLDGNGDPRPSDGVGLCGIVEQSLEGVCE